MNVEQVRPPLAIASANEGEFEWCARLMAGNEPWITLGRDIEACRSVLRRPGFDLFVAHDAGEPIGFVFIHPHGCAGSPYIASIAVAESARGKGIGSELLAFAERQALSRRFIFLCVSSFNRRAYELYVRLGYEKVGEIPDYIVDGYSELLLCKKLR
jgi:ribosomal protein S18 acetylase RimI-like enzyme